MIRAEAARIFDEDEENAKGLVTEMTADDEDEMYKLRLKFKTDFGSGYPADPKTKAFIAENFDNEEFKEILRFSWNTVKKLIKAKGSGQKKIF